MLRKEVTIDRPKRWDVPYGDKMTPGDVERLLHTKPFSEIDSKRFPSTCALGDLLLNDTRIVDFKNGDIIVREGDYGHSAFLILRGSVRVALSPLPDTILGRAVRKPKGFLKTLAQLWNKPKYPEVRKIASLTSSSDVGFRQDGDTARIFLQDVPGVLNEHQTLNLGPGVFFGELAALSRSSRNATIFANSDDVQLLEIRWQGLRELMKRDEAIKNHIHDLYRRNSLASHLRETPLLSNLDDEQIGRLVAETRFESHGDFEWNRPFKSLDRSEIAKRIAAEPVIAQEGHYADGLILIRSGFARLSRKYGNGHRSLSYLGKGSIFGFEELAYNWKTGESVPWQLSLRALGYVDILRIPTQCVERDILPQLTVAQINELVDRTKVLVKESSRDVESKLVESLRTNDLDAEFSEFLGVHQLINGTQAMLIDLDRCTRCDDCVRACADAHDNNPRFIRQGLKHGNLMVTNACMHCVDPVCMIGCPTGAIGRDRESGAVLINDSTCIGCSTCANSCPYQNIQMVEIRDSTGRIILDNENGKPVIKATKCDLCSSNLGGPACQRACPHDALVRIDLGNTQQLSEWCNR